MKVNGRIEQSLVTHLDSALCPPCPPRFAAAMRHAVFSGGGRVRPRLCLSVAMACGDDAPWLSNAMASGIELLHCASLVHDDLPCFDDAPTRRGQPSVHQAYGEQLAVLAGDALIVAAFRTLASAIDLSPGRAAALMTALANAAGAPNGIAAGQAWESEEVVDLRHYHRAKTGALFVAATVGGAVAAGASADDWQKLGELVGEAYQVVDDLRDVLACPRDLGKPVGQDAALQRPSAVAELGLSGCTTRLNALVADALASVPACAGRDALCAGILQELRRVLPDKRILVAA